MLSGKSGHLGAVLWRDYENVIGDYMVIKNHDGPNGDLISLHYIYTSANSCVIGDFGPSLRCNMSSLWKWFWCPYCFKGHDGPIIEFLYLNYIQTSRTVMCSGSQAISVLCYVETMIMVLVTIWQSRAVMVQIVIFFLWIVVTHLWTVMYLGMLDYFGIVLCRDYENGLGDYMAINRHDCPNSDLLSLSYNQTSLKCYMFGKVRPSRRCVMSSLWKWSWWPYGHQRAIMVQLVIFFLLIMVIYPEQLCVWKSLAISALYNV